MINQELWNGAGAHTDVEVRELLKALDSNDTTTDIATLAGYPSLQPQSFEKTLVALMAQEKNMTMLREIPKSNTDQTLHQYAKQIGVGQNEGWLQQMETALEADPTLKRAYGFIKYQRQLYKYSAVAGLTNAIKPAETLAKQAAALRCMRNMNRALYSGDESIVPEAPNGFEAIIRANGSPYHVIDIRGANPGQSTFDNAAQLIAENMGDVDNTKLFCSAAGLGTLSQLVNQSGLGSNSIQRYLGASQAADGGLSVGHKIKNIWTNFGDLKIAYDVFIGGEYEGKGVPTVPTAADPETLIEGATSLRAPQTPTLTSITVDAPTVTGSKWATGTVRPSSATYKYQVVAVNRWGRSAACAVQTSGSVSAGGSITLVITPAGSDPYPATGYEIYSEQVSGSGVLRYLGSVAANGVSAVSYVDKNLKIPGTTKYFILDFTSQGENRTCSLVRLAPLHARPYAPIGEYGWGSMNFYGNLFGYAPRKFVLIDNVPVGQQQSNSLLLV